MNESAAKLGVVGYLTKEEVERFFRMIPRKNLRDLLLFELIYRHALRRGEAALLRRDDVANGRISITRLKRGISGSYPLHPHTIQRLTQYLARRTDGNPYLFPSRQDENRPISGSTIYALYRRYATAADLPPRLRHPHIFRHSNPTHQLTAGADLADVKDWMGHKDMKSTSIYAQITNKRREEHNARMRESKEIAHI